MGFFFVVNLVVIIFVSKTFNHWESTQFHTLIRNSHISLIGILFLLCLVYKNSLLISTIQTFTPVFQCQTFKWYFPLNFYKWRQLYCQMDGLVVACGTLIKGNHLFCHIYKKKTTKIVVVDSWNVFLNPNYCRRYFKNRKINFKIIQKNKRLKIHLFFLSLI